MTKPDTILTLEDLNGEHIAVVLSFALHAGSRFLTGDESDEATWAALLATHANIAETRAACAKVAAMLPDDDTVAGLVGRRLAGCATDDQTIIDLWNNRIR